MSERARSAWKHRLGACGAGVGLLLAGCDEWQSSVLCGPAPIVRAASAEAVPMAADPDQVETLPIDLPTALRLADSANPTVNLARARVEEAFARLREAQVLWLPNIDAGPAYQRHDGQIQNSRGEVFSVSKSNFFIGGGVAMRFETGDALFGPLVARQLVRAQVAAARAVNDNVGLDVALTYLDLVQVYGQLAVNAETLANAEEMLRNAASAQEAGKGKTPADAPRARTEVELRREERRILETRAAQVSARLAQLLLLRPTVDLRPADPAVVPVSLVPPDTPLDDLVATGLVNRPELARDQALVGAAVARWRQARFRPLLPRLEATYLAGDFGGGTNDELGNWNGRGDGTLQAVWELRNFGLGDAARVRAERALVDQANFRVTESQAQVAAEVSAAAKEVRTRLRAIAHAQEAVRQAEETWRILVQSAFGLAGRELRFDPLEPLLAEQALATARTQYLNEVIEYNKAQFRLYVALGQPALEALPCATARPVEVPVVPAPKGTALPAPRPVPGKK